MQLAAREMAQRKGVPIFRATVSTKLLIRALPQPEIARRGTSIGPLQALHIEDHGAFEQIFYGNLRQLEPLSERTATLGQPSQVHR